MNESILVVSSAGEFQLHIPKEVWSIILTGFFTLAAAFGTIVVQHLLKRGKLRFYVTKWEISCYKLDTMGGIAETDFNDDVRYICFNMELDIFNSADEPNSLRNISIEYTTAQGSQQIDAKDSDTGRKVGPTTGYDSVRVINLKPKTMGHLNLINYINKANLPIQGSDVWFVAMDYKGKEYRVKLGEVPACKKPEM